MHPEADLIEEIKKHPSRYAGNFFKKGEYERGWKFYSYREQEHWGPTGRDTGKPHWHGEDLNGKTIVLGYEQALGEQIMFASYVADFLAMGAKVTIEVERRLITLFRRSFPTCKVVAWNYPWANEIRQGDYYTLIGNPGTYLRKTKEDFPNTTKYLNAKPMDLFVLKHRKIGVSWWSPVLPKNVPLDQFKALFDLNNTVCINLQYGLQAPTNLVSPHINLNSDIDGVASAIDACDVIVTISNTVAHIAGALGKPTYLLLSKSQFRHFYWDLPFYPTVIRMEKEENETWQQVISKIAVDIENKVNITDNNITFNTATELGLDLNLRA